MWLKDTALDNGHFPAAMIIDFETGYKYQPRNDIHFETLATDVIQFMNDYSLGLAPPLGKAEHDEEEL